MALHVSVHAEERFLERALGYDKKDITVELMKRAGHWLSQELDLTKKYLDGRYTLPSFDNLVAVVENNTVVTIRIKRKVPLCKKVNYNKKEID